MIPPSKDDGKFRGEPLSQYSSVLDHKAGNIVGTSFGHDVDVNSKWHQLNEDAPFKAIRQTDIDYKFNESVLLEELRSYINKTYDEHYGTTGIQPNEFIVDQGYGVGFCAGNVLKYINRYGKKAGYNRKDILKALHYALILLRVHDLEHSE